MNNVIGDVRYALRQFRLTPVFTLTAVLTLALGIGGTTAIFSLIHAVMLRSLPVADPAALYRIGDGNDCCVEGGTQDKWGLFSFPLYERLLAATREFEQVAAFQAAPVAFSVRRGTVDRIRNLCGVSSLPEIISPLSAFVHLQAVYFQSPMTGRMPLQWLC